MFTGNWLQSRMEGMLKTYGISHQQYNVLRILRGKAGQPANLQDISERMIDKMSNATRLVEKLRIKGFLTREICPENRRKVEILITPKGLDLLKTLEPVLEMDHKELFKEVSGKDVDSVNSLLDKLREKD